jgi:murein DD-endopeptidase MepM/ murein hydrolase activator NlpD
MLRVNQSLTFRHSDAGEFKSLIIRLNPEKKLQISKGQTGFSGSIIELPLKREIHTAAVTVESSLFLAGQSAGLSQKTIMNLVDIFQWDVDFGLDVREGDSFKVVYEKLYRDGEYLGEGHILAAEFNNNNRSIQTVRYTDLKGRTAYYTPQGRSMRKAFLRNPVDVVRITSRFNPNRKHPVLHTIRAHKGTDYGAPIGTPIRSTGDGKIIFAGTKGGYGTTVILKHGDKYTTLYAHMSKLAKKTRSGKRVQQGQVIGYVGKTGRVTGAHLHYEFRINGIHKNSLKIKLPGARPLDRQYRADFQSKSRDLLVSLNNLTPTSVAAR